jgi:ATP-binding cassette subfamily B protein
MRSHALPKLAWAIRPYGGSFSIGIISSVCNKILDLMPPLLVAWVIDTVQGNPPQWISFISPLQSAIGMAVFLSSLGACIFFFESVSQFIYQRKFQQLAQHVQHDIRCHAYAHLQNHDMSFFESTRMGQLIAVLNDDVRQLERFLTTILNELIQLIVLCTFSLCVMASTCWPLALFSLIPVPIVILGSVVYQRIISPYYQRIRHTVGELVSRIENNLSGVAVIKSFTAELFELNRVRQASEHYRNATINAIKISTYYVPLIRMVIAIGFAGVLLLGSYWVLSGSSILSIGELVLFSMMIQRLLWPLTRLGDVFDEYERANVSAGRLLNLLQNKPRILSPKNGHSIVSAHPSIEFNQVSFSYNSSLPVLNNLSFTIDEGQTIGLAGYTGAGKSSIIKCLLRFYDVSNGQIIINGHNITDINLHNLRKSIALVSQDVYLFHGTIKENIAYGNSQVSDADIAAAAKMAELDEFILSCPNGYNSMIGEKGIKLSGGQRQRLSIARAILKNAPIMIFDEATSSVDTETERAIKHNLSVLTQGKTALIIAHRLSTIRHCDQIFVLNKGKISESGTHQELLEKQGHYHDLWTIQTGDVRQTSP